MGINVIDTFKLAMFHHHIKTSMTVKEFPGVLSHQLLHYLDDEDGEEDNEYNSRMTIGGQQA